ncbi:Hypothetical protein NTJ_15263 [Nesidiocoris tenuis]|uniref:Uncharacterized protein n=1 Tax=Nesidiocoris tenuis TaxID=355587 RepID=A0ABN7BDJ2_9HEMI|nr:Hypothetical protein NTJ_15263 [Nesidiocoris tenuis]
MGWRADVIAGGPRVIHHEGDSPPAGLVCCFVARRLSSQFAPVRQFTSTASCSASWERGNSRNETQFREQVNRIGRPVGGITQ